MIARMTCATWSGGSAVQAEAHRPPPLQGHEAERHGAQAGGDDLRAHWGVDRLLAAVGGDRVGDIGQGQAVLGRSVGVRDGLSHDQSRRRRAVGDPSVELLHPREHGLVAVGHPDPVLVHHAREGQAHQLLLGLRVAVEVGVRDAGLGRDLPDADARARVGQQQARRGGHQVLEPRVRAVLATGLARCERRAPREDLAAAPEPGAPTAPSGLARGEVPVPGPVGRDTVAVGQPEDLRHLGGIDEAVCVVGEGGRCAR